MRRQAWLLVLVPLLGALAAVAAWGRVLLVQVATSGVSGSPAEVAAAVAAAQWAWLLGVLTLGALAAACGLSLARRWWLQPLRTLAEQMPPIRSVEPPHDDDLARLILGVAALQQTAHDRAQALQARLGAIDVLRGAADTTLAQLQETDRLALVGRVALGVAHEVGGPLAVLVAALDGCAQLERDGAPAAERLRYLDQAEAAARQIGRILGDLSQPGLPSRRDDDRPCDLATVARRVVALAALHPRCRRLTLRCDGPEGGLPVDASASHVEQVLLNLVLNASDAVDGLGRVQLTLLPGPQVQRLRVDDDGPGVPVAERERIFAPFHSGHPDGRAGAAGWGLGLAVSRRVVAQYGGALTVDDAPGGGARFELSLPVPVARR
jgi:signal transduction histidine kinase